MSKPYVILAILFSTSLITFSQVKFSLDDCINLTLRYNLQLKKEKLNTERQRLLKDKSFWNYLPSVDFVATQNYEFGFTIDPNSNSRANSDFLTNDFELNFSFDVLDISKLKMYNKSKIDLEKAKVDYEYTEDMVLFTIVQNYIDVLMQSAYLDILNNQLIESEKQWDRLKTAYGLGYIAKGDLNDAESLFLMDKQAVLVGDKTKRASILKLFTLINYPIPISTDEVFEDIIFDETTVPMDDNRQYYFLALKNNQQILSAEYGVESAKKEIEFNKAKGLPTISLHYKYGSFYSKDIHENDNAPFRDQIKDNKEQFLGASLQIPIFNGLQNSYDVKLAKLNYMETKFISDEIKNQIELSIQQSVLDVKSDLQAYKLSLELLEASKTSFRTTKLKYESGKISAFEFANAKKNLFQSEYSLMSIKYQLYFNKLRLNLMTKGNFEL